MTSYEKERQIAFEAAVLASRLCLSVRMELIAPDRLEKVGREPVTVADFGAQAVIMRLIAAHFPDDGAVAEEKASDFETVATPEQRQQVTSFVGQTLEATVTEDDLKTWLDFGRGRDVQRRWVVDPIDGTKGFLRGDQFAIAIGLLDGDDVVVAALGCPALPYDPERPDDLLGVIASAERGQGATLSALDADQTRTMSISPVAEASKARAVEGVETHHDHSFSGGVLQSAGVTREALRLDSQAKYLAVADGRAEIYIRNSKGGAGSERIWDHAAGALVVEEAGGRLTDLNGQPLDFTQGDTLAANWGILASNGPFHDTILTAIVAHNS
ncbi:MAG: 3'(2'),5'-bisphosphate nucleotidase [Chloroflexi bacterium]|nr:3'(2'),5'-bisphosphate nucleotidase [Chloroflexota bacterium]